MQKERAEVPGDPSPDFESMLERFGEREGEGAPLRDSITASWRRSVEGGLRADRLDVPFDSDAAGAERLAVVAAPVIEDMAKDLDNTEVGLFLTDEHARIVTRKTGDRAVERRLDSLQLAPGFVYSEESVGTNAIGTALEHHAPFVVEGSEHFADALTGMACAATPIADPATGRATGVIDLTSGISEFHPLMLPLVKRAAWEIEQRLLADSPVDERILQERFLKARRGARGPLAAISGRTLLVNGAAAEILHMSDREQLWDWTQRFILGATDGTGQALIDGRPMNVRCEPVRDGLRLVGALIRLDTSAPAAGLASLTTTERAVADHVARGLTNAEAAARMFLSPHTIDFHLRQVFRKLGVRSRVELTRVLLTSANPERYSLS